MADVAPASVSEEVVFRRSFIYQSIAKPVFVPPTGFTFFSLVEGDTGLRFQKTIIYQVSAEAESPETHVFWYEPWADPMRRKVSVANQPSYSWSNFTPTVTPPVVTAVEVETVSGGVIFPRSFIYQSQTRSYFFTPETITVDKWFEWLSEPKRFKRGLKADEQQFIAYPPPFPNFIRTIGWFESLSEPKRFKKGLGAWLQQFFTTDQNKPVANPVFFSLNAVEINLDTALFGIAVGEEPVPVGAASASVTVVEIPAISGASASIQET